MATFHLLNFGCRASQADGATLKKQLLQAGLQEGRDLRESQIALLNTCTVTAAADAEIRQVVRRIHRLNPTCRILVTGCYAQRAPEEIAQLEGVSWVVGNSHKHTIAELLKAGLGSEVGSRQSPSYAGAELTPGSASQFPGSRCAPDGHPSLTPDSRHRTQDLGLRAPGAPTVLVGEVSGEFHFTPVFPDDRTRPTVKVQDGCNARCSFCVIPYVRGRSRSLPPEKVIEQIRALEEDGYQEIVLCGINLGSYGRDLGPPSTFLALLEGILRGTNIRRIRISSIEPMDVSAGLIRLVAQEPRLARHFHVPLQSGCDRILRLMNRRYWAAQYADRLRAIHEQVPNAGIGSDVMVGFPGETDQDHATSLSFIDSLPFTYLHIFPFSARPGTPAAASSHQVNGRVARKRSQEIRALMAEKRRAFLGAQIGQRLSALTLDETTNGARVALTTNYLKVTLPGSELPANHLLDVRIARAQDGVLYGYQNG